MHISENQIQYGLSKKVTYLVYITGKTRNRVKVRYSLIRHTNGVTRISLSLCSTSYMFFTAVLDFLPNSSPVGKSNYLSQISVKVSFHFIGSGGVM